MIEIRQVQPGDLEKVLRDPYQEEVKDYPGMRINGDSFAGELDGELLGIGGIIEKEPGIGEAWLMLTKSMEKGGLHGIHAFHAIRKQFNEIIEAKKLTRCDALVRDDFPKAKAYIEAMGFKYVETKIQLPPLGVDMHVYSKAF